MRRVPLALAAVALLALPAAAQQPGAAATAPAAAGAGTKGLDLWLYYANEPLNELDGEFGVDVGFTMDIRKMGIQNTGPEVQGRVSLGYYSWDKRGIDYERVPLFVGAKILSPVAPQVKVFGQLGVEFSFDDISTPVGSDDEVNVGFTPGAGVQFDLSPQLFVGGALNWHIIEDDYWTFGAGIGFRF